MLELEDMRQVAGPFDPLSLTHPWRHPDPRVDGLQELMARVVGVRVNAPRRDIFDRVWNDAHAFAASTAPARTQPIVPRTTVRYLNEPWYC